MGSSGLLGLLLVIVALVCIGGMAYFLILAPKRGAGYRNLMSGGASGIQGMEQGGGRSSAARRAKGEVDIDEIKVEARRNVKSAPVITLEEKMFHAGLFSEKERADFRRFRVVVPCVATPLFTILAGIGVGPAYALVGLVFGIFAGLQYPLTVLERKKNARAEDIMFFLPLVIEQIAIGVSSSLDIGPCLQKVVSMSDERSSHNVVTELLKHTQYFVKSGVSLQDALVEIARLSGNTELKHTFMSLAQVAKHGGEISRQLQELADAVAGQREAKIEEKIKKLELHATGPVGLVFFGFIIIVLSGLAIQVFRGLGQLVTQ